MEEKIEQSVCGLCGSLLVRFSGLVDRGSYIELLMTCEVCGFMFPLTFFKKDIKRGKKSKEYIG